MNKIKVVNKAGVTKFVLKGEKGQQLNENEIYAINSNKVDGLLQMDVDFKGSTFQLIYNTAGLITMKEYLMTPMNKDRFAWILQCILWNLEAMEKVFFNQQCLLLGVDKVMVNPVTRQIYFAYAPIQFFENEFSVRDFLLEIIQHASFGYDADTGYVQEYFAILNKGMNFSVFDLEEYVNRLLEVETVGKVEKKQSIGITKSENPKSVEEQSLSKNKNVYDPLTENGGSTGLSNHESSGWQDEKNTHGETEFLGHTFVPKCMNAYLVRTKSGEQVRINKPVFGIGKKAETNDFVVSDNPTVSRNHAKIETRDGQYFIIDLKSTNRTYVDGTVIQPEREVKIFSGTKIRMSNEEFVFLLKEEEKCI